METLSGGRSTGIYRQGETVVRPIQEWSATVHRLLRYLHQQGFHACPEVIGMDTGSEVLSFVEGDTYNYPLEGAIASEEALISAARLLRQLHDVSQGFLNNVNLAETVWMLPAREPAEVICHGDFTPYNVALNGNEVVGAFDLILPIRPPDYGILRILSIAGRLLKPIPLIRWVHSTHK